jgi:hypothetical protein
MTDQIKVHSNRSNATRAARAALGAAAINDVDFMLTKTDAGITWAPITLAYIGQDDGESAPVPTAEAREAAQEYANETGEPVPLFAFPTGAHIATIEPVEAPATTPAKPAKAKAAPKAKAEKAPKPAKAPKAAKAPNAPKDDKATMTAACLDLARRPEGVTAAELNELTQWKGAPWKWLFSNPKKTGWCDRRGLDFSVTQTKPEKGRATAHYHVGAPKA